MKVSYIRNPIYFDEKGLVLALGFFDGFHLAHQKIINKCVEIAHKYGAKSAILTFDTSIMDYLNKRKHYYLSSFDDKISLANSLGVDEIFIIEVSDMFINLSREEFYEIFLKNQKALVFGYDYSFGYKAMGNPEYLKSISLVELNIVDKMELNNEKIGSMQIKEKLSLGDAETVKSELGRPYAIKGEIYERNKKHAISSGDYYLPRNGKYELKLENRDKSITFIGKVKKLEDMSGLVISSEDEQFLNEKFIKNCVYTVSFLNYIK